MLQEMSVCLDIGYLCSGLWGKSVLDCTGIQEDTACTYIQVDFFLQQNGGEPTQGCQLPGIKRYHLDIKKKHPKNIHSTFISAYIWNYTDFFLW